MFLKQIYTKLCILLRKEDAINTEPPADPFPFKAKAFCNAGRAEACVAGELSSSAPFAVGQEHHVKERLWKVVKIGQNHLGDVVVNMKPA